MIIFYKNLILLHFITLCSCFHNDTDIIVSPYLTLAVVWTTMHDSYVMCEVIVWENTNVVHFSCDMGKWALITGEHNRIIHCSSKGCTIWYLGGGGGIENEKIICRHKSQKKYVCWKWGQKQKFAVEIDEKYVDQENDQMATYIIGKAKFVFIFIAKKLFSCGGKKKGCNQQKLPV